ncbi:hypothetical protein C8R44DRAFT_877101 [Mycena epipterygia]|nr:hypothetical protein C8R44DRAFT_877101 [Mycena epipterygia]
MSSKHTLEEQQLIPTSVFTAFRSSYRIFLMRPTLYHGNAHLFIAQEVIDLWIADTLPQPPPP